MKSRLFLSILVLVAVVGTAAFGAFAFFTFQASAAPFTISSASASLQKTALTNCAGTNITTFGVSNAYPGMPAVYQCATIKNDGTAPLYVDFFENASSGGLADVVDVQLTGDAVAAGPAPLSDSYYALGHGAPLFLLGPNQSATVEFIFTFPETGSNQNVDAGLTINPSGYINGYTNAY